MSHHLPPELAEVASCIDELPGLGPRTAQRLAIYLLRAGPEFLERFSYALTQLQSTLTLCLECNNISNGGLCPVCSDATRDKQTICVVADVMDLMAIENSGIYMGLYHVLNGSINPLEGITPKDIHVDSLIDRIEKNKGIIKEILLGLDTDTRGETTSLYLISKLRDTGIVLSRLGRGLPTGSDLEYADAYTLRAAIEGRKKT